MQYDSEFQLGTRSLERHVEVTRLIGLLPIVLCATFIASVDGWQSPMVFYIFGTTIGLELILWGLYEVMFTAHPNSRAGERIKLSAPKWFPLIMLIFRYTFFAFTFLVIWNCFVWLGIKPTLWIRITFYMVVIITPVRKLIDKLVSADRKKWADVCIELLKHLHINTLVFFVLGLANAMFLTEKAAVEGVHAGFLLTWLVGVLVILSSSIILLDYFARYEQHKAK